QLDLDAPVARYWPEFAVAGKARITTRHLLTHSAGLAAIRQPLPTAALYDWRRMTAALAAETPWWEPGSASGYHALTYGYLVGEVVRRVTGTTLGAFFREEVAARLPADFHIGLAPSEDARVAEMVPATAEETAAAGPAAVIDPESLFGKVLGNPPTFGHGGWGGSLGVADLDARVSWSYVMNKMSPGTTGDSRAAGILASLYASL